MALPKGYLGHAHNIIRGTKIGLSKQYMSVCSLGKLWARQTSTWLVYCWKIIRKKKHTTNRIKL